MSPSRAKARLIIVAAEAVCDAPPDAKPHIRASLPTTGYGTSATNDVGQRESGPALLADVDRPAGRE